jgi:hypothetical protein
VPLSKITAGIFGVVYGLVGLVGFAVTGFGGSGTLIIFNLSVLHNVVHVVIGVSGLAAFAAGPAASKTFCQVAGGVLGVLAIVGVIVPNPFGILPLGGADIGLHVASALVLLYVGFAGSPRERVSA